MVGYRPELVLPPDVILYFLNCLANILFIFKILKQGTQIAFEFYFSFQKLQIFWPLFPQIVD